MYSSKNLALAFWVQCSASEFSRVTLLTELMKIVLQASLVQAFPH